MVKTEFGFAKTNSATNHILIGIVLQDIAARCKTNKEGGGHNEKTNPLAQAETDYW